MTEDSFKTFNWKPELRKKFFTKEQQSPEKLLFPDLRMKSGIQNLVRQKFQQILDTQTKIGFEAAYFITYHYSNPYERKPNEEFMTYKQQERQMKKDIETMKRRFDYDCTTENSTHIRNVLLKLLFGITRPDVYRGELPCMFFFHEMGDLGFHTHLMIPRPTKTRSLDNKKELRRILNQPKFRKKVKPVNFED